MDVNSTAEVIPEGPSQFFGWLDFTFFLSMLGVSTLIGIYFGFWGKKEETPKEYLHGGKTMSTLPVAVSLVTSVLSGVAMMGTPTEIYRFGTIYWNVIFGAVIAGIINYYLYLPVFYELQITSTYEYLEMRFSRRIRVMASVLYTINLLLYVPIVVYVPALVLSQVSGLNIHFITVGTSIICVFYTMLGGLKAVVWTDFLQGLVMLLSSVLIIIFGLIHAGGFGAVWQRNEEGGRIQFIDMDPNPFIRLTSWSVIIGTSVNWMSVIGVNQSMVQKFISVPTIKNSKRSLILCILGIMLIKSIVCYIGLLIYSAYYNCDPIKSKAITRPDQLASYYVIDIIAPSMPGLPGLFVAGIFSAALSTMSGCLNSLGATLFEDFVRPRIDKSVTDETINKIIKSMVIIVGSICLLFVFIVDKFGNILQLTISVLGVTSGSMLGLFTFGMFFPRGNSKGALAGSISSLLSMSWIVYKAQEAISDGRFKSPLLPTSTEGCVFNVTIGESTLNKTLG
ncbi:Sodium-coupled monocarboxylate transporter 1 [Blattella germanica]|nr:Sodium-coupled monocarboxylate transporter 1 [Blattella germanica]